MIQSPGSLHLRFRSILTGGHSPPPFRPSTLREPQLLFPAKTTTSLHFRSKNHCEYHLFLFSTSPLYLLPQLLAPHIEVSTTLTPDPESRQRHATYAARLGCAKRTLPRNQLSLSTSDTGARFVPHDVRRRFCEGTCQGTATSLTQRRQYNAVIITERGRKTFLALPKPPGGAWEEEDCGPRYYLHQLSYVHNKAKLEAAVTLTPRSVSAD